MSTGHLCLLHRMDGMNAKPYSIDFKFAKLMHYIQLLNSSSTKIFGYNVYNLLNTILVSFFVITLILNLICSYRLTNDIIAFVYCAGVCINFSLSCYKFLNILYYSKAVWKFIDSISGNFLLYSHYNRNIFLDWWRHSITILYIYNIIHFIVDFLWIISPLVQNDTVLKIRHLDGSYTKHRMNIYNLFLTVSEETYNNHYNMFFLLEVIITWCFYYFSTIFDSIMIIICCELSSQLDIICDGIKSLGYLQDTLCTYGFHCL